MGKIVAIGGGEIKKGETFLIDKFIVEFSGRQNPNFLFIPTASRDAGGYINSVKRVYKTSLGCSFSTLLFFLDKPQEDTVREKIENADIIYVGGGNTELMMKVWHEYGIDKLLKDAYCKGTVLCGVSAGSICWFKSGYSDSAAYGTAGPWEYEEIAGLGLLNAINCPHYDDPGRSGFDSFVGAKSGTGIAIDNCAALFVDGDSFGTLSCKSGAGVYLLKGGEKKQIFGEERLSCTFLEK
ncbi:MAG: peptidase E [Oscillospiraceae bacterium]